MKTAKRTHQKWSKEAKKAQKKAKKKYALYNDATHCNALVFIWGVTIGGDIASFYTLNAIDIVYNRDTGKYILDFDLTDFKPTVPNTIDEDTAMYLRSLQFQLNQFVSKQQSRFNLDNKELNVSDCNWDSLYVSDSLEELQIKFNVFVNGLYHY